MSLAQSKVPFLDIRASQTELEEQILEAWGRILRDTAFIGGPEIAGFECELAATIGVSHAVGVSNGTDALMLCYLALGLGPGDELITVPHTFIATAAAATRIGARVVFVDVDRAGGTLDPRKLEAAITPRTKLIVPVHLYGQPADLEPILEIAGRHGIRVVEDTAQAQGAEYHGRPVGGFGVASTYSFYPGKNLGACGDAGAVATGDPQLAERVRKLRDHGQPRKYVHDLVGFNARLDALQAAVLRIKLPHLPRWNEARRAVAHVYDRQLADSGLELPLEQPGRKHIYHLYVVRHPRRDEIARRLDDAGVVTGMHYPVPLHLQQAYADLGYTAGAFPESERWARCGLSLPIYPGLTAAQVDRVCEVLLELGLEPFGTD